MHVFKIFSAKEVCLLLLFYIGLGFSIERKQLSSLAKSSPRPACLIVMVLLRKLKLFIELPQYFYTDTL